MKPSVPVLVERHSWLPAQAASPSVFLFIDESIVRDLAAVREIETVKAGGVYD
jgi:hypothetical protein